MPEDLFPSHHPLTSPHHVEDWVSWLRLLRSRRVGPATFLRLMREHGNAKAALAALPGVANAAGVKDYQVCPEHVALAELNAGRLAGAELVAIGSDHYPEYLSQIADPPPMLWTLGDQTALARPMIAIVGARNASSIGTRMARKLADELSQAGYLVVSGLARGIDAAAHIAAREKGTLAVMAGGVDVVYPAQNAVLAQEILENGVRLSEQPMGLQPHARHFPQRNRIISGLCCGVVVVEAAVRSGSLITAKCALDQGRDVFAVPGHPFDARATGANFLIKDGATLVRGADDIIAELGSATNAPEIAAHGGATPTAPRPLVEISKLHTQILARLGPSPVAEDQLIRDLELTAADVAPALINLELDGKISRQPGGLLHLAS